MAAEASCAGLGDDRDESTTSVVSNGARGASVNNDSGSDGGGQQRCRGALRTARGPATTEFAAVQGEVLAFGLLAARVQRRPGAAEHLLVTASSTTGSALPCVTSTSASASARWNLGLLSFLQPRQHQPPPMQQPCFTASTHRIRQ